MKQPSSFNGSVQDSPSLILDNCKLLGPEGVRTGAILIIGGKIAKTGRRIQLAGVETINAHGLLALPGMIDVHVHLRDLELSYKENFTTGTSAAIAGGFTTVLDMPNTRPVTDSSVRLKEKMERANRVIVGNVGFHAAAVADEDEIGRLARTGAFSLKLYMPHPISKLDVNNDRAVLRVLNAARKERLPVTVHAEDMKMMRQDDRPADFVQLAETRPAAAEISAVNRILRLAEKARARVHLSHLTLPSSINQSIRHSSTTFEVTPHHMLLSTNFLLRKKWKAWMVPPLRPEPFRKKVLSMVSRGPVRIVASDHAPHALWEKTGSPLKSCPPGVPGLETTLPLMLTLVNRNYLTLTRLVTLLSTNPAQAFNLKTRGKLRPGFVADIVIVNLRRKWKIKPDAFQSKAKYSPFENRLVQGHVETTIVNGRVVFDQGQVVGTPGSGQVMTNRGNNA